MAGFRGAARINVVWRDAAHPDAIARMDVFAEALLVLAEAHGFSVPMRDVTYSVESA